MTQPVVNDNNTEVISTNDNSEVSELSSFWPPEIQQWGGLITPVANQYQIDPDLIAAIMFYESGGKSDVISRSGAVGLMQVMSRDTSSVMPHLFKNRPTSAELKNPEFNIRWGVHYLAILYHYWGENWREALYHYGPIDVGYSYSDFVLNLYAQSKNNP